MKTSEDARFQCLHPGCGATYRRKEHLVRHAARHSQNRVLVCEECGLGFDRTDTLKRHRKIHFKPQAPASRVARACDRCHAKKSKCDGNSPCGQCSRKGAQCIFSRAGETDFTIQTDLRGTHQVLSGGENPQIHKRRRLNEPPEDPTAVSQNGLRSHSDQATSTGPSRSEEESVRDLRIALLRQEACVQDDAMRLADSRAYDFYLDERDDLTDVTSTSGIDSTGSSPASNKIEYYVGLYFAHFHEQWPFIFKNSFRPRSEPRVLVLATAMIGMWITGEGRLQRQAWAIHARLHTTLESQISNWCVTKKRPMDQENPRRWPLATYQAILLFTIFTLVCHGPSDFDEEEDDDDDNILFRVRPIFTRLVRTCRVQGVFHYPSMLAQNRADDPLIYALTSLEELKYFALTLYRASVLFSRLVADEDPENTVSLSDLQFPLPDNGYLWASPCTREWFCRRERQLRDPPPVRRRKSSVVDIGGATTGDDHDGRTTTPWISDVLGDRAKLQASSQAERRRAWMRMGPWLGYMAGVDLC